MYFSIRPSKDTTIYGAKIDGKIRSGSNAGQSEILELFHLTESASTNGDSRILLKFDLDLLSSAIAEGLIPSSSVKFNLTLKNAVHYEEVPYSYEIKVFPLTTRWDEGRGLSNFDEELKDKGVANWLKSTHATNWTSPGGDFSHVLSSSQYFEFGTEDLSVDITNIVNAWLTGGVENHGLLLKFDDFYETGSVDFYVKKFFSRHSLVPERQPRIDVLWEGVIQDDRSDFSYEHTGTIAYYRFIDGQPSVINGPIYVDIWSSSSVVQTLTASSVMPGIYVASGAFIEPDGTTEIFRDVWFTDDRQLFTGSIVPIYSTGSIYVFEEDLSVSLPNLKPEYTHGERTKIKVFAFNKDYRPSVVREASLESDPVLFKDAYFQIENAETEEVIVSFSTGSVKYSKLSYDAEGNYFDLWTDAFPKSGIYKIKILSFYNNRWHIFDNKWFFKVV